MTKHRQEFDKLLTTALQGEWAVDPARLDLNGEVFFVSWGSSAPVGKKSEHGSPLGRLSASDLKQVVKKGLINYGMLRAADFILSAFVNKIYELTYSLAVNIRSLGCLYISAHHPETK